METILDKEKMESMRALAETNMKVSEVRNTLSKLKDLESEYFAEREKRASELVKRVIEESSDLLNKAYANHEEIKSLSRTVSEFSSFLTEAYDQFRLLMADFEERNAAWESVIKQKEEEISKVKQQIGYDRIRIKNDQEAMDRREEILRQDRRKIIDERATLERAIKRLKEGKI